MVSNSGPIGPSWPVVLLPFMERNDIYSALVASGTLTKAPAIPMYTCPSNPPDGGAQGVIMYAGNCGSGSNLANRRYDGVMLDTAITAGPAAARIDMGDISNADGTVNTLLLSEKSGLNAVPGSWLWNVGTIVSTGTLFSWSNPNPPPGFGIEGTPLSPVINASLGTVGIYSQPSSAHPGGAVVVFCDGHTRFVTEALDAAVYANLLNWKNTASSTVGQNWVPRAQILDDNIGACRALWGPSPATFTSPTLSFKDIWCDPKPWQHGGPPVFFSGPLTKRNVSRIVNMGSGWIPIMGASVDEVIADTRKLREAFAAASRDPDELRVRGTLPAVKAGAGDKSGLDLDATLATAHRFAEGGITDVTLPMGALTGDYREVPAKLDELMKAWQRTWSR